MRNKGQNHRPQPYPSFPYQQNQNYQQYPLQPVPNQQQYIPYPNNLNK